MGVILSPSFHYQYAESSVIIHFSAARARFEQLYCYSCIFLFQGKAKPCLQIFAAIANRQALFNYASPYARMFL